MSVRNPETFDELLMSMARYYELTRDLFGTIFNLLRRRTDFYTGVLLSATKRVILEQFSMYELDLRKAEKKKKSKKTDRKCKGRSEMKSLHEQNRKKLNLKCEMETSSTEGTVNKNDNKNHKEEEKGKGVLKQISGNGCDLQNYYGCGPKSAIEETDKPKYKVVTGPANLMCKKDTEKVFIRCRNESAYSAITKKLPHCSAVHEISEQIWFGVTAPNRFFTGREKEMELLEKYWNECLENETFSIVAVTGLGGVGKTEVIKNFARWFYKTVGGHCIWVKAECTQSVIKSFHNLAKDLQISINDHLGKERSFQEIVEGVYETLYGQKVLFVFDNVENYELPVLQLLIDLSSKKPPTVLKPFVITTSRFVEAKKQFGTQCNHIDLQVLSKDSASANQFLYKSLDISEPSRDIMELIYKLSERLQFYPLALQQAAAYINERSVYCGNVREAISRCLTEIEKQPKTLLNYKLPKSEALENISNTTFLTWRITIDKIIESKDGGEIAVDIMNIISFLSPDNIPTQMVTSILQKMEKVSEEENVDNLFELIRKHSMINFSVENIISVKRLVQEVTIIEFEERGEFSSILSEIAEVMIDMLKGDKISLNELVHVQTVWKHLTKEKELIQEHGEMLWCICCKLLKSDKYRDAFDFSIESEEFMESALGQNNRWALLMKQVKGTALFFLGDSSEALEILEETYEKQKDSFGVQQGDFLITAHEIGGVYYQLGKYDECNQIYNDALDKAEKIFGKDGRKTLEEVLEVNERLLGVKHQDNLKLRKTLQKFNHRLWPKPV